MTDKLETDEFIFLVSGCEIHQRQMIKDFIRQHFTPKTVEQQMFTIGDMKQAVDFGTTIKFVGITEYVSKRDEFIESLQSKTVEDGSPQRTQLQQLLEIVEQKRNAAKNNKPVKDALSFVIEQTIRLMFEDAHAELDSPRLIKGREEKGEFYCENQSTGGNRCNTQCVDCSFCYDDTSEHPTPNRDNYREELLRVATVIAGGTMGNIDQAPVTDFAGYARYVLESAKAVISAIDKEVKSNPEAE